YRSCEDILEAIKPLCKKHNAIVTLSDKIIEVAGQLFVEACATFEVGNYSKTVTAQAMHSLEKKGMDASQITGSSSSYARKYALNGLFCIDDNKDADTTNTHGRDNKQSQKDPLDDWRIAINALNTEADLTAFYKQNKSNMNQDILNLLSERKAQ